jgi:hypothetical protein
LGRPEGALWLWITLLFANFAEAVAEGRGKAQAATLHKARTDTRAKRLFDPYGKSGMKDVVEGVSALDLKTGGVVLVEPGDLIPSDGDVIEGIALIDESANPHPISHRRTSLRGKFPASLTGKSCCARICPTERSKISLLEGILLEQGIYRWMIFPAFTRRTGSVPFSESRQGISQKGH